MFWLWETFRLPSSSPRRPCCRLPALLALKQRLQGAEGPGFDSVFMTGSGSTIVCVGSGAHFYAVCAEDALLEAEQAVTNNSGCCRCSDAAPYCRTAARLPNADTAPAFLSEEAQYSDMFVSPARLITRPAGEWYAAPTAPRGAGSATSAAAAAVA